MPTFKYQALTPDGKKKKGFIESDSKSGAVCLLQEKQLLPIAVEASRSGAKGGGTLSQLRQYLPASKVNLSESFFYLSLMLQSGTSLAESLDLLGRMSGGTRGRIWLDIREKVESGRSFSASLQEHPRQFPLIYVGMVQVAEEVGKMAQVLEKIAEYEEQRRDFSGRILTAMAYPCFIMLLGACAVYFLLTNVLPGISDMFANAHAQMPVYTRFLLAVSSVLQKIGPAILIPPVLAVLAFAYAYRKSSGFKIGVDRRLWKVPLIQKSYLARFSGLLGFQLESGIPLVRSLNNASAAIGSSFFKSIISDAAREVSGGRPLDKVLAQTGAFPDIYLLTLSTGQKAGALGSFLARMAGIFERDVDNSLKRIMALVEPSLIVIIGIAIGFIVISILTPIMEISRLVG